MMTSGIGLVPEPEIGIADGLLEPHRRVRPRGRERREVLGGGREAETQGEDRVPERPHGDLLSGQDA